MENFNHAVKRGAVVIGSPLAIIIQKCQTPVALALNPDRFDLLRLLRLDTPIGLMRIVHNEQLRRL
jgi:hypothetical protein